MGAKPVEGCTGLFIECLDVRLQSVHPATAPKRFGSSNARSYAAMKRLGHREMVLHRHDQQQRGWRNQTDIGARLVAEGNRWLPNVTSLRHDGAREAAVLPFHG